MNDKIHILHNTIFQFYILRISFLPVFNIFVLDEPCTLLDENYNEKFKKMLSIIKEDLGMKVILVTNLESYKEVIDNAITIEKDKQGYSHLIF